MQKNQVAILDVGSSKITAAVGERGVNKTFIIKSFAEVGYSGYSSGKFFDETEIKRAVVEAIGGIKKTADSRIESVFVSVPGIFTRTVIKSAQVSFSKQKKITGEDVDSLYATVQPPDSVKYTVISRSPIFYEIDGYRKVADPLGQTSETLSGQLSFILCDNSFIKLISEALNEAGTKPRDFISTVLAESLYLFEPDARDRTALLLDVGYISTDFAIIKGDGILFERSVDFGGGFIMANLAEKFELDVNAAEALKRKIILSVVPGENDLYEFSIGDKNYVIPAVTANLAVNRSLDALCEVLSDSLRDANLVLPEYIPLSLTGGGISFIRGAKEHISGRLNTVVEIKTSNVPYRNKPTQSSFLSILDLALGQAQDKKGKVKNN